MNQDSFEQVAVPAHLFDDALPFVRCMPPKLNPLSLQKLNPYP